MSMIASLLVVVAVVCLLAGLLLSSSVAYIAAAVCSAAAVLLLWRYLRGSNEKSFVTDAPAATLPDWDRPLRTSADDGSGRPEELPAVAIEDYDELMAAEILPSLETLSVEELEAVVTRERMGLQRQGVMARAQRLIDLTRGNAVDISDSVVQGPPLSLGRHSRRSTDVDRGLQAEAPGPVSKHARRRSTDKSDDFSL